ncbi:MAG: lipid-A-disaccharide synthase [Deltaproteobacteria bacterium]|nr:lipid-A-disaccharide synthase [Deltaproteobacteria bacterium]MBW2205650.1 lipid-A-disaccharide synthase [Deltaproteobacteria bacterium]
MERNSKLVLIVAGEASADHHGANLVAAIKRKDPGLSFAGIGGAKMESLGVQTLVSSSEMAVVGFTEVFSRFRTIIRAYLKLKSILKNSRPDLLILIDYPEFNLFLARRAKRYNVPVLYYICPQVWAWRKGRIKKLAKRVDRLAVILPFEADFYRARGLEVEYVGHPLLDGMPLPPERSEVINELGFENNHPVLGLLPGSRIEEVTNLLPPMIKAAEILSHQYPHMGCIIPLAPTISKELVLSIVEGSSLKVKLSQGDILRPLALCDLAFVASGTATLETAIMAVPMVIVYRISPISYWVAGKVVDVTDIGLVNYIAGERIVPELIQKDLTPRKLAQEGLSLLRGGESRENMIKNLERVRERLGRGGASERTAEIAMQMLSRT